jgi:hypothetical protein
VALIVVPVVGAAAGWFVLAWRVAHNTPRDAIGQALGVAFGLLILFSVIGAVRGRNHSSEQDR